MSIVVVTGATGFVGANLVRRLMRDGHQVHLLVRAGYAAWRIAEIADKVHVHEVSLGDIISLNDVMLQIQPDWTFHLAVHGAYSWQRDVSSIIQTNVVGTANLLDAARSAGCKVFVNTGSSSEYGFKDHAPSEDEALEPNSYYSVAKAAATMLCRFTGREYDMKVPTLRLYSVYGAYEQPGRLIPELIRRGLQGELPPLVNPDISRDYVYIDDVIDAYMLAATVPQEERGPIYNIGSGVQTSLRDIVDIVRKALNIETEPTWGSMPNRDWDTNTWVSDNHKAKDKLKWTPNNSLTDGLAKMIGWYMGHSELHDLYQRGNT